MNEKLTIGFVPANRRYFSTELASKMRGETLAMMEALGIEAVVPDETIGEAGCVKNQDEGKKCGELFRKVGVDGILVGAMNFGDEQACVSAVLGANANVPVMIFGCQEEAPLQLGAPRRDSFCGLLSIAEAFRQTGVKYTIADKPICFPHEESFHADLDRFARVCRVLRGIRGMRIGQIGTRPEAFWTCRYDEKMLQQIGVTVAPKDLSELLATIARLSDDDPKVQEKLLSLQTETDASAVSHEILVRIARFECGLEEMIRTFEMDAVAIQCWNSLQLNYGIVACGVLARMGERGVPVACEADVLGALSMQALRLAADSPAALLDWNNLHNDDPELVNLWHCGVYPPSFGKEKPKLMPQGIMSKHIGAEISTGAMELTVKPSPATLCRAAQGLPGEGWKVFIGEGAFEDNEATTFGGLGWCRIPGLPQIYREILLDGFTHHIAVTQAHVGNVLYEVFGNYLGMAVYHGGQATPGVYRRALPFTEQDI
ncbi:MAG: L-fucose/L-arabinose isomerase family protein [Armatimonadetes bacterium]|nr:L-fucose/L-arabinose isomerase family protein [Armatimonadota bacterium]